MFSILWKGTDAAVPGPWEAGGRHAEGEGKSQVLAGSTPYLLNSEGLGIWLGPLGWAAEMKPLFNPTPPLSAQTVAH